MIEEEGPSHVASVVATDGDSRLGGSDFTAVVKQEIFKQLRDKKVLTKLHDSGELLKAAVKAKEHIFWRQLYKFPLGGTDVEISAEQFSKSAKPLWNRMKKLITRFLLELGVELTKPIERFDRCVLVGGGSLTLGFKEMLEGIFPPLKSAMARTQDARTGVAKGAAHISAGTVKVNDRLSRSLGIAADELGKTSPPGKTPFAVILPRNTFFGRTMKRTFTNKLADQRESYRVQNVRRRKPCREGQHHQKSV